MRLTKAIGLAAVAAVAAMAFIGTSSALAVDSVVICKTLVNSGNLCPANSLWPSGSVILALAANAKLHNFAVTVECEDSLVEAKTTAISGASLPIEITKLEFGTLPTPSLGSGCVGCTVGVHPKVPMTGAIEVSGTDVFNLSATGEAELLGCPGNITCAYGTTNGKSKPITHDGSHVKHSGNTLPKIKIELSLTKTLGSIFCPGTGNWLADYIVTLVHTADGKENGLGWPALDNPVL